MRFRASPYYIALVALTVLLLAGAALPVAAGEVIPSGLSVVYSDSGEDFGKITWRVDVYNPGEQAVTVSLILILEDAENAVVFSAARDGVSVPAGETISVTQTDPIRKDDWNRVASHSLSIARS